MLSLEIMTVDKIKKFFGQWNRSRYMLLLLVITVTVVIVLLSEKSVSRQGCVSGYEKFTMEDVNDPLVLQVFVSNLIMSYNAFKFKRDSSISKVFISSNNEVKLENAIETLKNNLPSCCRTKTFDLDAEVMEEVKNFFKDHKSTKDRSIAFIRVRESKIKHLSELKHQFDSKYIVYGDLKQVETLGIGIVLFGKLQKTECPTETQLKEELATIGIDEESLQWMKHLLTYCP